MQKLSIVAQSVKNSIHTACIAGMCEAVRHSLWDVLDAVYTFIEEQPPEIRPKYYRALGELIRVISREILEYTDARSVEQLPSQD